MKINITAEEAKYLNGYNPIEHTKTRLKNPESIISKLERKKWPSLQNSKDNLFDIAGMRIICFFVNDGYDICERLFNLDDSSIIEVKDYIKSSKPNSYQSLN